MGELKQRIDEWLRWDRNEQTLAEIKNLVNGKNDAQLSKLLLTRLKFGTAGLRGRMQAGFGGMNDLVILQTAQGLMRYLEQHEKKLLTDNGIVVGYDGRHNSKRWAEITTNIFVNGGYKVRLFRRMVPTPFVPFSVKKYKCAIGVVVTASHNPKDDNGYKVYAPNSVQIIPPADKQIQELIMQSLEPWPTSWDTYLIQNNKLVIEPLDEVLNDYTEQVKSSILPEHMKINKSVGLLFTYTPMHGVGLSFIKPTFDAIGLAFVATPEQKDPHPDFPTVPYPNPEEGKSCLDLSMKLAEKISSTVIIANDPDADRLACAEKNSKTGEWKIFNGNELGALLGWWSLQCFKTKNPQVPLTDVYMISSTVSSMILKTMAKQDGFRYVDTLTGFKWIANKAVDLTKEGKHVIFCFEEAIGFMYGLNVLDKDGISGACHLGTMTSYLKNQQKTLLDQLESIYETYGFHTSINSYYICHDQQVIKAIFERLRNYDGAKNYPKGVLNGKYAIKNIRDLTTGYDDNQKDNKAVLPTDATTQMITFYFENGLIITIRTSGTEPKIKYYSEMCASPEETDRAKIRETMVEQIGGIVEEFLEPKKNNLIPQSS